jgi:phosphotriesterase-related protein
MTVGGPIPAESFGMALPHEHVMVDFAGADQTGKHRYDPEDVFRVMLPYLQEAREQSWTGFVDCTPAYIGRDPEVLGRLSEAAGLHILTNTGYYKEPYLPSHAFTDSVDALADRWVREYEEGIEGTPIRPGFIKIAVNSGPLVPIQQKIVRAAARAHRRTGLTVASHTEAGPNLPQGDRPPRRLGRIRRHRQPPDRRARRSDPRIPGAMRSGSPSPLP